MNFIFAFLMLFPCVIFLLNFFSYRNSIKNKYDFSGIPLVGGALSFVFTFLFLPGYWSFFSIIFVFFDFYLMLIVKEWLKNKVDVKSLFLYLFIIFFVFGGLGYSKFKIENFRENIKAQKSNFSS